METSLALVAAGVLLLAAALVLKLRSSGRAAGRAAGPGRGPGTEGSGTPALPRQPVPTLTASAEAEPEDDSATTREVT